MLNLSNLSVTIGGKPLFSNGNIQIYPGDKVGLVGPNGAGKTTIFRIIVGEQSPDKGDVAYPKDFRISYFSQNVGEMSGVTALEHVISGEESLAKLKVRLSEFEKKLCDPSLDEDEMQSILEKMGEVQTEFEQLDGYTIESRAEEILTGLGIKPQDHQEKVDTFSGGWKMRIALARVLVTSPDLIIMDEPTNYLDMETILWLESWLKNFKGAVFMTTHDQVFMENIAKKIVEVSGKKITTYNGDFNFYLKEKEVRLNQLKSEFKRQEDSLAKEEEFIARFKARASHAAQVQSRVKKLDKIERVELPEEEKTIRLEFPDPPRGSNDVAILTELSKSWKSEDGSFNPVFENLTLTVKRSDKTAVVGVNGAGKSTLLKTICSITEPTSGSIAIGPSIKIGYFGQHTLDVLHRDWTVIEELSQALPGASTQQIRGLLGGFLFTGDDIDKKIKHLSGGEKARVLLAILFSQQNNFLILDEPTNHLDLKSREILLEALKRFDGTILFVSHDRHFLHGLANSVIEVDKVKGVTRYPGDYSYYLQKTGI